MNIKAKKTMFIIALIITLASCGGGSGGNGGNGYTQNPAPSKPSIPETVYILQTDQLTTMTMMIRIMAPE